MDNFVTDASEDLDAPGFEPVSDSERSSAIAPVEWPTVALILGCHVVWLGAGLFVYPLSPVLALAVFSLCVTFHSSLQHEVLHGHPTRNPLINEMLVFLPLGLFYPYRSYKETHLQHHTDERLTDPYDDPESYYRAFGDWLRLPRVMRFLLTINNTLVGRVLLGPPLNVIGFTMSEWRAIGSGDRLKAKNWLLHVLGAIPVIFLVQTVFCIPIIVYATTAGYLGLAVTAIRSYSEHQWSENPDGRTIIVERSLLAPIFLYNNLHIVHHKLPWVPWYRLPATYRTRSVHWQEVNRGYVFRNYLAIIRAFAFRMKEPVVHPALRCDTHPQINDDTK
ncbi:fatty acid desaturase [Rhizobium multihospitium]|uniref:Fatty acid desaturase n=1 Tax=Rhizobium multihospitium TaxID=410764 RepID=A0A1C3WW85_9HYPH|nr:fatty acid desaturase [Rhizobium multihospitium]SCB44195.1 Fatty acid desaturase [Rhizobium multihospitium]